MRKILLIVLLAVFVGVLAGCGPKVYHEKHETIQTQQESEPTIIVK